jgi:hypothetical protein
MQIEEIEKFLGKQKSQQYVKISFKKRDSFLGLFLIDKDFDYLKSKNFWRIVPEASLDAYRSSGDNRLARIYSGSEFTRLAVQAEVAE